MHYDITKHTSQTIMRYINYFVSIAALVVFSMVIGAGEAMAQAGGYVGTAGVSSTMGTVVCCVIEVIYGNLGRGFAVLAVIIVGVGASLGKVSWGLAILVATGIAAIFGAVPLVAYLLYPTSGDGWQICAGFCNIQ